MIEFLSSWSKSLGVTVVIVSILEMLLPNNKTKKYIRMVMGVYILFTMISPFIKNKEIFDISNIDLEDYTTSQASTTVVDQSSMDERIKELYQQELEKDIIEKLKEQGYEVTKCKVEAQIDDNEKDTKITKIRIEIEKSEENSEENIESQLVTQVQKIKPIDTSITKNESEDISKNDEKEVKITKTDIQNVKKFLIEEYGVNEKCLKIN